jgi:hypothetical protein
MIHKIRNFFWELKLFASAMKALERDMNIYN